MGFLLLLCELNSFEVLSHPRWAHCVQRCGEVFCKVLMQGSSLIQPWRQTLCALPPVSHCSHGHCLGEGLQPLAAIRAWHCLSGWPQFLVIETCKGHKASPVPFALLVEEIWTHGIWVSAPASYRSGLKIEHSLTHVHRLAPPEPKVLTFDVESLQSGSPGVFFLSGCSRAIREMHPWWPPLISQQSLGVYAD